jgi:hypothetical protein
MAHFENHWFNYRTCRMQLTASKFNVGPGTLLPGACPSVLCYHVGDFADMYTIK